MISLIAAFMLLAMSGTGVLAGEVEQNPDCTYFVETGHNLCEPFEDFWNMNGGLPVFGFPITEATDELNPDLNLMLPTQWFERERLEYHEENAGTIYEILLGRLGNEVLLKRGEDWQTFPKADPSSEHYFAETGQAIAPEFWEYWSSHGLELGPDASSFAESVALFGYPISDLHVETNSSGHTVPTQWFERARFELHEDRVLLGLLGNEMLADMPPPGPVGEVIAEGLNSPRGIDVDDDGNVFVAEAGVGGDDCIMVPGGEEGDMEICFGTSGQVTMVDAAGNQSVALDNLTSLDIGGGEIVGAQDVTVLEGGDGVLLVTMGLGADPAERDAVGDLAGFLGQIVAGAPGGPVQTVVDIAAYEQIENPDGGDPAEGGVDSNPYSFVDLGFAGVVSDAGANALLLVDDDLNISTLAVFEDRMVDAPPFLGLPEGAQIPMESVPTGMAEGPDGAVYVGELTGFPFVPGAARVWRVTEEGQEVYADGFTNLIDVAFDGAGNLYVLEMVAGGLLNANPEDPSTVASRIVKIAPDGAETVINSAGLVFATGMAIGPDGTIYVSNFGVMPGMGQVVAISGVAEPFPEGPELTVLLGELNNPRGIAVSDDGSVYFAQVGPAGDVCQPWPGDEEAEACFGTTGTVEMLTEDGSTSVVVGISSMLDFRGDMIGVQDVAVDSEGLFHVVVGLGADGAIRSEFPADAADLGWLASATMGSGTFLEFDVAAYESDNNPDGDIIDSNPYSLASDGDGGWVISDAGANALFHRDAEGNVSTLAVLPPRLVVAPPEAGLPEGTEIPMQSVPTGVVMGPDGAFYVGELTGFPFVPGAARIWRVTIDGEAEVIADGFTNIVDVAFDSVGNLYALELAKNGLLSGDISAAVVQIANDGSHIEVASDGLLFATGLTIGPDDIFYVSNFGVMPGMGQIVSFTLE